MLETIYEFSRLNPIVAWNIESSNIAAPPINYREMAGAIVNKHLGEVVATNRSYNPTNIHSQQREAKEGWSEIVEKWIGNIDSLGIREGEASTKAHGDIAIHAKLKREQGKRSYIAKQKEEELKAFPEILLAIQEKQISRKSWEHHYKELKKKQHWMSFYRHFLDKVEGSAVPKYKKEKSLENDQNIDIQPIYINRVDEVNVRKVEEYRGSVTETHRYLDRLKISGGGRPSPKYDHRFITTILNMFDDSAERDKYPTLNEILRFYSRQFKEESGRELREVVAAHPEFLESKLALWYIEHLGKPTLFKSLYGVDRQLAHLAMFKDILVPFLKFSLKGGTEIVYLCGRDILYGEDNPLIELYLKNEFQNLYLRYLPPETADINNVIDVDFVISSNDVFLGTVPDDTILNNLQGIEGNYSVKNSFILRDILVEHYRELEKLIDI